jgi:regulatory protein
MNDDAYKAIYNKALDIISRREHSQKELSNKLIKKFNIPELVDSVIDGLLEKNLLNDYRYSESYVVARKRKGFGPKKIVYELVSRGVNENTASEVIDAEGGWNEAALKAFNKKFKAGMGEDYKEQNKQKVFLQNRGFSFEEIDSVFN